MVESRLPCVLWRFGSKYDAIINNLILEPTWSEGKECAADTLPSAYEFQGVQTGKLVAYYFKLNIFSFI